MSHTRIQWIAGVMGILACSTQILAWGDDGHRIVGWIAEQHLVPEARAAVEAILEDGETLAECSLWADEIKGDSAWEWARPLHYVNVRDNAASYDHQRDCPESGCVVSAINDFSRVLRSPASNDQEKLEALRFIAHFIGDVHQPLHVSREADRGGNNIKVELYGYRTNLHSVWDTGLIKHVNIPWTDFAATLNARISPRQIEWWSEKTAPEQWADESWALSLSHAYEIPEDGSLDDAYFDRNMPVIEERLMTAGIRLANHLNALFQETGPAQRHE